jgi:hypothetical protein
VRDAKRLSLYPGKKPKPCPRTHGCTCGQGERKGIDEMFNNAEQAEPPECVTVINTPKNIEELHFFGNNGKCINCGWCRDDILNHPHLAPWELDWGKE